MASNPATELIKLGQSIWYDNISRELLDNGDLKRIISEWGVRGLTSNPTIFDKAISEGTFYDSSIEKLKGASSHEVFEALAVEDIGAAADLLAPLYEESNGDDGFVSIEVSPLLAADTKGSITEAKRLYQKLERPNVMIKIPGTPEGLPAVRALLEEGISVNITLLFSVGNYEEVAKTYIEALRARDAKGLAVDKVRSVASFFVSRVDAKVDAKLEELGNKELQGKFGIANSRAAYHRFQELFADFGDLAAKGAKPQRPLWASTSTKNPEYRDVLYVEELIGDQTVNTVPHSTLEAFVDHGNVAETISKDIEESLAMQSKLEGLGVNVSQILDDLQTEGVKKFSDSFEQLNASIEKRLA